MATQDRVYSFKKIGNYYIGLINMSDQQAEEILNLPSSEDLIKGIANGTIKTADYLKILQTLVDIAQPIDPESTVLKEAIEELNL